jgi:hypothetical protein
MISFNKAEALDEMKAEDPAMAAAAAAAVPLPPQPADEAFSTKVAVDLPTVPQPTLPPQLTPQPMPQPPRARVAKAWPKQILREGLWRAHAFEESVWPPTPQPTPSTSPPAAAAKATADVATDAADDGAGLPRGLPKADPAEHQFPLKLFQVGTRKCVGRYEDGSAFIKVLRWIDDDNVKDGAGDSQASQSF